MLTNMLNWRRYCSFSDAGICGTMNGPGFTGFSISGGYGLAEPDEADWFVFSTLAECEDSSSELADFSYTTVFTSTGCCPLLLGGYSSTTTCKLSLERTDGELALLSTDGLRL